MNSKRNVQGFSLPELLIVISVIAVLGFGAWLVYQRRETKEANIGTSTSIEENQATPETTAIVPETIVSTKDLDTVGSSLDAVNLDSDSIDKDLDEALNF